MEIWRQGDIALIKISEIPKTAKIKDKILAYGEVTGHKHQFKSEQVTVFKGMKQQFVDVRSPAELVHEEHATITIPEGKYMVIQQREFDIVAGIRTVLD